MQKIDEFSATNPDLISCGRRGRGTGPGAKTSVRVSAMISRGEKLLVYTWLQKELDWDYVEPFQSKSDLSKFYFRKCEEGDAGALRVRPPHGNRHYPCVHWCPEIKFEPFDLVSATSAISNDDVMEICLPQGVAKKSAAIG